MLNPAARKRLAAVSLIVAASACGDDDPASPNTELTLAQVVAQCTVATLGDATGGLQRIGRVDSSDCIVEDTNGGRIEGWRITQASFGGLTELQIDVAAGFDAVIIVLAPDGTLLADSDTDIGGDFGREQYVILKGLDPAMPEYFIGVFSYPGEPAGDYTIDIGPP